MSLKSGELKPTVENLINCLKGDYIDRNNAVERLVSLCTFINEGCSIAIDGKWGDGKTFFVKQAKLVMDSLNPFFDNGLSVEDKQSVITAINSKSLSQSLSEHPQVCIYYDSWINDNDIDPLISMLYEISRVTSVDYPTIEEDGYLMTMVKIADTISGRRVEDLLKSIKGQNALEEIRKQKAADDMIEEYLEALLPERGERLVIIIDELDRCKPTYALKLLERVKHFFDNERITFIFAINTAELQHSVKKYYGESFDACRYLDRFFDYRISLPPANMEKYYQSIGSSDVNRFTFDNICRRAAEYYGLSLREAEKYIRISKIAAYKPTHNDTGWSFEDTRGFNFGFMVIVPLIIVLRMVDINAYNDFVAGRSPQPLIDLLINYDRAEQICTYLLSNAETYADSSNEKSHVELADKLKDTYKAIFNTGNTFSNTVIGQCEFSNRTKKAIMVVASMLSEYASYT